MQLTYTNYITNSLQDQYQENVEFQIKSLLSKAKTIKKGIFTKFVNKADQDYFDYLNSHSNVHIELFEYSTQEAIDSLSKYAYKTEKTEIIDDLYLVDLTIHDIKHLITQQAEEAMVNCLEFDAKTAKKRLCKRQRFLQESIAIHAGLVCKYWMKRCTSWGMHDRKNKLNAQAEFQEKTVIRGLNGETFALKNAGETAEKRLNELYVISKGIEKLGEDAGMKWASIVATVPGHMHPNPARGQNTWDGTLPNESAKFMHNKWVDLRACLAKLGITLSGLWTRESHLDGTPHINFLVYFNPEDEHLVRDAFNKYYGHSKNAIEWQNGGELKEGGKSASFASYALKYFQKFFSKDAVPSDECVSEQAWASAFSLRRYGFFGIPSLQQWRRLRAQRETPKFVSALMMSLWRAARANNSAAWIALSGGLGMKNKQRPFRTITEPSTTGKSRIATGVEELKTGLCIISKRIGEWTMVTLQSAIDAALEIKKSNNQKVQKEKVTLALSYPSIRDCSSKIVKNSPDLNHFNADLKHILV
jgi:hypothetical protein